MSDGDKGTFFRGSSCRAEDEGGSGDSQFRLPFSKSFAVSRRDSTTEQDVRSAAPLLWLRGKGQE